MKWPSGGDWLLLKSDGMIGFPVSALMCAVVRSSTPRRTQGTWLREATVQRCPLWIPAVNWPDDFFFPKVMECEWVLSVGFSSESPRRMKKVLFALKPIWVFCLLHVTIAVWHRNTKDQLALVRTAISLSEKCVSTNAVIIKEIPIEFRLIHFSNILCKCWWTHRAEVIISQPDHHVDLVNIITLVKTGIIRWSGVLWLIFNFVYMIPV